MYKAKKSYPNGSFTNTSYNSILTNRNVYSTERLGHQANTSGDFALKLDLSTSNQFVSPLIDVSRYNLVTIKNKIDNAGLSNSDVYITSGGVNYSGSATATVSGGGGSGAVISLTVDTDSTSSTSVSYTHLTLPTKA